MICQRCGADAEFATCWECSKQLRTLLLRIRDVVDELDTQVTRQNVGAKGVGSGTRTWRLPFDTVSSDVLDEVFKTLARWYATHPGVEALVLQGLDRDVKVRKLLAWHAQNCIRTSRLDNAGEMFADLERIVAKATTAIDRQDGRVWIADCRCGRPVQAWAHRKAVFCACGELYDVQARRETNHARGADQLVTVKQAVSLGEVHGRSLKPQTIRQWHRREKLADRGQNQTGEYIFRFGDIIALAVG